MEISKRSPVNPTVATPPYLYPREPFGPSEIWVVFYFLFTLPYVMFTLPIFLFLKNRLSGPVIVANLAALHVGLNTAIILGGSGLSSEGINASDDSTSSILIGVVLAVSIISGIQSKLGYKAVKAVHAKRANESYPTR